MNKETLRSGERVLGSGTNFVLGFLIQRAERTAIVCGDDGEGAGLFGKSLAGGQTGEGKGLF